MKLSPTEAFNNRRVLIIGATGFVGKVTLSMLLTRFPGIGKVYVTVRARGQEESETRFWNNVITSPPFDPLREIYEDAFDDFIREKVVVVNGDIGDPNLGFGETEAARVAGEIDVVINSAGNVTFNPTLESALRTNVVGTQNVIHFARRMKRPALVHVSTCFVAGRRSGPVWESDPVLGYFPRHDELPGVNFSPQEEIKDCERLALRVRDEVKDTMRAARFRETARERLIEEGRDPDDLDAMGLAVARERKLWTRERLTELGIERAQFWGWDNIYTYTKSLGEQLVAAENDIVRSIVRPSIVESANEFPFPGWNEGFTTTAPLIFITLKGQTQIPVNENLILDITPVDQVAAVMLAVAAEAITGEPRLVYQAATGDSNPNDMKRIVGMVGLHKRQHFDAKDTGIKIINKIAAQMEARAVTGEHFERTGAPAINAAAKKVSSLLDRVRPKWGAGRFGEVIDGLKTSVDRFEELTHETKEAFELFRPFMRENAYIFRADNIRSLFARIPLEERHLLPWFPERLDWYHYWMHVHFPGLKKWVFPTLEEDMRRTPKRVYTYRDLLELFETSTKRFSTRVAMRIERDGHKEQYTYANLRELATRAAAFLATEGVSGGDRVMLLANNAPEWGMTYFGVMKAGATCVPVDPSSTTDEVVTLANASNARAIVISREMDDKHTGLRERLNLSQISNLKSQIEHSESSNHENNIDPKAVKIYTFDEVFAMRDKAIEDERIANLPVRVTAQTPASFIFTSGTTGTPKAVMLTHKNFANMVSMLASVIDMDTTDGVLSVLPLHHTFEFSTGFLTPLSRGAQITYLPELNSEELSRAIKNGHVTGLVGVPAVWEALHRRIKTRLTERGRWAENLFDAAIYANSWVRDRTPLNIGRIIFQPIHQGLGGRIRYLISGGSALSESLKKDLHGLGFTVLEGYGLTEAAPVLTVVRPGNRLLRGSVGTAVPGVDVRIDNPDSSGVGEVIARGANVMLGYYDNDHATRQVIRDRWLYTGDLGRLDTDGNLYLVGRSKEVIIDSNGKNIYPDEIEDLYSASPFIKELSVVGLPENDGTGERVACMVVPEYTHDIALSRSDVRRRIEAHFRDVSSGLAFHKRVKILHFSDEELPRTATRKVKRRIVVEAMQRLEQEARTVTDNADETATGNQTTASRKTANAHTWLIEIVAVVANKSASAVTLDTRLADLGFDSLMFVELTSALEASGAQVTSIDTLNEVQTVRELLARITSRTAHNTGASSQPERPASPLTVEREEIHVPSIVRTVGDSGLNFLQERLYDTFFNTTYEGRSNIPVHTNFIVAPNHTSHLDIGLVKMALGASGKDMVALAAADYFFDNKYKRAYMDNFTNLVPMERAGSLRQSLRHARSFLERGYNALVFPEGTRSVTGELQEFKSGIGYIALSTRTGILPVYLHGTHESMPKGSNFLHVFENRDLTARIGRFLTIEELETLTDKMPRHEAYRLVAALVRHEVERLRDNTHTRFDPQTLRRQWRAERRRDNGKTKHDETHAEQLAGAGD
ncbi:MAG: AMP-binding protein [Pyrinomonadaceae bacterium MAG19_C2-C3]|nr:AMP-binding protein [Pyrinomonadaceae bacterium MAG19_C2-C3]